MARRKRPAKTPGATPRRAAGQRGKARTVRRVRGRAVGGVTTRAVGGPIVPRAVGGPVAPRWVTSAPPPRWERVAAATADGELTVVYVHGIGNKPAPGVLKRQWDHALFGLDMGSRTRLAYWADIRYPQPTPASEEDSLAPSAEAYHPTDVTRTADAARRLAPYGREAEAYAARLSARLLTTGELGLRTAGVQAKVLPGFLRRPVVEWLTQTFIQDTAAYLFDPQQRGEMQNRLRQILMAQGGPFVVIAHSQGSMIAYDVLRGFDGGPAPFDVRLFVTLGSPLGLDEVQDHLTRPLRVPRAVKRWSNFADLVDPVALDKDLEGEFAGAVEIEDEIVVNRDTLRLSGFNPHSGSGYLATKRVRETVRAVVGATFISPVAPFVIARDVATEMADPTQRQRVLIEVKDDDDPGQLETRVAALEEELREMEREFKASLAPEQRREDYYAVDPLRRYVSAQLTPQEIDWLASRHRHLQIANVWKDSVKRTLLTKSSAVVQATTARLGYGASGRDIHWAVLDTGINPGHSHFSTHRNIAAQLDCTRPGPAAARPLTDGDGHGTHVAGIIAGVGVGPHESVFGIAPEAKLHVYKVLDDSGFGHDGWIIKALDHIASVNDRAADLVIHGVNLSLGGPFDESVFACGFSPICRELRRLWRQGVVVCIAAGNEGRLVIDTRDGEQALNLDLSIGDPANLEEAIAVGSVHREFPHLYGISYFSSRGPTADGRPKPDVVAPGEKIFSCDATTGGYVEMSGTSMACPHVSGVIAAFLSVRREFIGSPERVKDLLLANCTDLKRDRYHQGAGFPNLVRMLLGT